MPASCSTFSKSIKGIPKVSTRTCISKSERNGVASTPPRPRAYNNGGNTRPQPLFWPSKYFAHVQGPLFENFPFKPEIIVCVLRSRGLVPNRQGGSSTRRRFLLRRFFPADTAHERRTALQLADPGIGYARAPISWYHVLAIDIGKVSSSNCKSRR